MGLENWGLVSVLNSTFSLTPIPQNMNMIIIATLSIGILGLVFGAILAYAAKKLKVVVDPRIEQIEELLPGANCGGCGYAGCAAYAKALVEEDASITACAPGGKEVSGKIAEILGQDAAEGESNVAKVRCRGDKTIVDKIGNYKGIKTCSAVHNTTGGDKACAYGCLGYGDCEKACLFDAIHIQVNGLPEVDEDKCTGCGLCAKACPRNIIELVPRNTYFFIKCSSKDFGKAVSSICKKGCIGCSLCVKANEEQGIKMDGKLPVVDYKTFKGDKTGAEKCPPKVIEFKEVVYTSGKKNKSV